MSYRPNPSIPGAEAVWAARFLVVAGIDDPAHHGDLWANTYDDEHGFMDPQAALGFLAELG